MTKAAMEPNSEIDSEHVFDVADESLAFTKEFHQFYGVYKSLIDLLHFIVINAANIDENQKIVMEALLPDAEQGEKERMEARLAQDPGPAIAELRKHRYLLLQLFVARGVDNYLSYLSDLLKLVFTTRPETMRSGETVRLDELLRHQSMDDLISDLAEQRVEVLGYKSIRELSNYLDSHIGFSLCDDPEIMEGIAFIVDLRNLTVHNRGIINRRFSSRHPKYGLKVGHFVSLDYDAVVGHLVHLARSATEIDRRASSQFRLTVHRKAPTSRPFPA